MSDVTRRVLAAVFALTWLLFPGFGLIDLSVTWDPSWARVLEAGWGVFFTVLVGAAFVAVAVSLRRAVGPAVQLYVAAAALAVAAPLAAESGVLYLALVLTVETAIVCAPATAPLIRDRERMRFAPDWPLTVIAAGAAIPWSIYAFHMFRLNRRSLGVFDNSGRGVETTDITIGIDHYAVQGALGIAVAVLALLAGLWPAVRRYIGVSVALAAGYIGLVSLDAHPHPGSVNRVWSLLCVCWAGAILIASLASRSGGQVTTGTTQ